MSEAVRGNKTTSEFGDVVRACVRKGAEALKQSSRHVHNRKQGEHDLVTDADLAIERAMLREVQQRHPGVPILTEESQPSLPDPTSFPSLFIFDPLDGSANFAVDSYPYVIAAAHAANGVVDASVVYDPIRDDLFTAERGLGAYLNGRRISCRTTKNLSFARVVGDLAYDPAIRRRNIEALRMTGSWGMIRGSAIHAMCQVAAGRDHLYFNFSVKFWDSVTGGLIAQEAGAQVYPDLWSQEHIVVGHPTLVAEFLKLLADSEL